MQAVQSPREPIQNRAAASSPMPGSAEQIIRAAVQAMLDSALALHRAGQFEPAAKLYGQILKIDSNHADSLHLLGMVANQARMTDLAIELIEKAISINHRVAAYHSNLGTILQAQQRLTEAAAHYAVALILDPQMAETHLNLGLVLQTQGRLEEAISEYRQALALDPQLAEAHSNLGNGLQMQGELDEAIRHYQQALALKPAFAQAWYNLGNAYLAQKDLAQAVSSYQSALAAMPTLAEAHCNLGNALQEQKKLDEAVAHYEEADRLKPGYAEPHYNLGNILAYQGKLHEATAQYGLALLFDPGLAKARNNLGNVYRTLEMPAEAVEQFLQVPESDPEFTDAYNNLGLAYLSLGRHQDAIAAIQRALALKPYLAEAWCNLGTVHHAMNRIDEARAFYLRALELKPTLAKAALNLGLIQLVCGEFEAGWQSYELRWDDAPLHRRDFAQPQWRGEPLNGGRILLHHEQGYGDTLQFLRYVPMVQAASGTVLLEVQSRLARLAAQLPGVAQVVNAGDPLPDFDCHCPLLSLPLAFGTTLQTVPAKIPYLFVPDEARQKVETQVWPADGQRIGLVWAGNPSFANDHFRFRSMRLELFQPLIEIEGLHWFSLQVGEAAAQLNMIAGYKEKIVDLSQHTADWADTAAQIAQLDLVITVDTSVAHLAGALGKPVWVLMPYSPDWRWLQHRPDSPWYPNLRLFRQKEPGEWKPVVEQVRTALLKRTTTV